MILAVIIQSASVQDRIGAMDVVRDMKQNWIKVLKIFADGNYTGKLIGNVKTAFNIYVEMVKRNELA